MSGGGGSLVLCFWSTHNFSFVNIFKNNSFLFCCFLFCFLFYIVHLLLFR